MGTTTFTIIKNSLYVPAFILGAGISENAIVALTALILLDTFLGVIKSGVVKGWSSLTSSTLAKGVISKLVLLTIPVALAFLANGIDLDVSWVVNSAITVLILSETYSVIGNAHSIRTGKDVPEFDAIQLILDMVKRVLDKAVSVK